MKLLSRLLTLAIPLLVLLPEANGQIRRHLLSGTVTSTNQTGFFAAAQVGDPIAIWLDIDPTTPPNLFNQAYHLAYNGGVTRAAIQLAGTYSSQLPTTSDVDVGNNQPLNLPIATCTDSYRFNFYPTSSYTRLTVETREVLMQPACPDLVQSFDIPNAVLDSSVVTTFEIYDGAGLVSGTLDTESITLLAPNDDCANAIVLPPGYSQTAFNAIGATTDGADAVGFCDYGPFGNDQNYNDIWFRYTPTVSACTYITTKDQVIYDTRLTVYEAAGCPDDPGTIIACVDDEVQPAMAPYEAGLDVDLIAGTTYMIRLGTFNEAVPGGTGWITVSPGIGAAVNSGGSNPGAPGCGQILNYAEMCNGDGGDQVGCTNCPCGNNAPAGRVGGCLNSAGYSAHLIASGDASVSLPSGDSSDLRFVLTGAPSNAFCILNSGDAVAPGNVANPCFGQYSGAQAAAFDGLRCAITNTRRHGGRSADLYGAVGIAGNPWGGQGGPPAGIAQAGAGFTSGQIRFFQVVYRDDATLGCMRGLNTSQAVRVIFVP